LFSLIFFKQPMSTSTTDEIPLQERANVRASFLDTLLNGWETPVPPFGTTVQEWTLRQRLHTDLEILAWPFSEED